jgi:hypothetical protein
MYVNQPVAKVTPEQVSVEPKAPFSVVSNGEAIVVQFTEKLRYDTSYKVTVRGATSRSNAKPATFVHTFKTADPLVYYLDRNRSINSTGRTKNPDEIVRTKLSGGGLEVVYSAPRIQEFAVAGDKLVVATIDEDDTNDVVLVDLATGKEEALVLPSPGTVSGLRISTNQRLTGLIFTSRIKGGKYTYIGVLMSVDLALSRNVFPVSGVDKKPVQANDWLFAPDGTTILAHTHADDTLLIDTKGKYDPRPLGQSFGIANFSHDGSQIILTAPDGPAVIDAVGGKTRTQLFKEGELAGLYPLEASMLANSKGHVTLLQEFIGETLISKYYLKQYTQDATRTLYEADGESKRVISFAVLPNDQYVAVEESDKDDSGDFENYPDNSKPETTRTLLLDTTSGKVVREIDGFGVTTD